MKLARLWRASVASLRFGHPPLGFSLVDSVPRADFKSFGGGSRRDLILTPLT